MIVQGRRRDGELQLSGAGQKVDAVLAYRRRQRRAPGFEVGNEIAQAGRVEDCARQHVRAGFARFFEDGDRQRLTAGRLLKLGQSQRGRQPGRTGTDDQDINFESLSIWHWIIW